MIYKLIFCIFISYSFSEKIFDFTFDDGFGNILSLNHYKGKVLLIVNVASECGYTETHYRDLVQLQNDFGNSFQVLAFPCNDFGQQEPNDVIKIINDMRAQYQVNFPIYGKVDILTLHGLPASPLFKFLQDKTKEKITWNFHKFLISHSGEILGSWSARTPANQLLPIIEKALHNIPKPGNSRGSRSEF